MPYTFEPSKLHAKAYSHMRVSTKDAFVLCRVIRRKKLTVAKRLLGGLVDGSRNLEGQYYTNASRRLLELIKSCEANAKSKGLDIGKLVVYASAHRGPTMRRGRRKSGFGSRMKSTNVDVILVQNG
jgi:ribosomal protein L22